MGRTHNITISEFDLNKLEADLSAAEREAAKQAKRANENHAWALRAERERDAERTLADRLAEALKFIATDKIANANDMRFRANKALTAWKEARND